MLNEKYTLDKFEFYIFQQILKYYIKNNRNGQTHNKCLNVINHFV